jgi:hypothetical protein
VSPPNRGHAPSAEPCSPHEEAVAHCHREQAINSYRREAAIHRLLGNEAAAERAESEARNLHWKEPSEDERRAHAEALAKLNKRSAHERVLPSYGNASRSVGSRGTWGG